MFDVLYIVLLPLAVFCIDSDVTFKNVEFKGYSGYTWKFTKTIGKSDSLKEHIPKGPYNHLEFLNQYIPVLHTNSITDIDNLEELTINNCELTEIQPGTFKNLPLLQKLTLSGNNLQEIKAGVFNNLPLLELDISKNRIQNIETSALDNLPKILNINFANNQITEWNKRWFHNTPLLSRISMQNNSLEEIPAEAFTNLNGAKKYGFVKLELNLIFSYNKISHIDDGAFKGLTKINNLWLDNNQLTEFNDNLLENVEVQDLRIKYNHIRCLTGDLGKIIKAETTHVDGNPFDCECLENIKKWAHEHKKNVDMIISEMNCIADRISYKIYDTKKRLQEIKGGEDSGETTINLVPISQDIS